MNTQDFSFTYKNRKINGYIDQPQLGQPRALIVIIPGDGKTDFQNNKFFLRLREEFVINNYACCVWDKIGCGRNKGKYKQLPVSDSADEAFIAITELRNRKILGYEKIGLWGISRAGWICPLIMQKDPLISFWISVSGTNEEENFAYMLKCHLERSGLDHFYNEIIVSEWIKGTKAFLQGSTVFKYLSLTRNMRHDSIYKKYFGQTNTISILLGYYFLQKHYKKSNHYFDEQSGLEIYINNMKDILKINIPVLAIFGKNDINVDWEKTKELYEKSKMNDLEIRVFENANHSLYYSDDGLHKSDSNVIDGFYSCITSWLNSKVN
jgi:uncharacterized protein